MAPESAGTGGPCESYHRCPGCGRCCCRCRRRPAAAGQRRGRNRAGAWSSAAPADPESGTRPRWLQYSTYSHGGFGGAYPESWDSRSRCRKQPGSNGAGGAMPPPSARRPGPGRGHRHGHRRGRPHPRRGAGPFPSGILPQVREGEHGMGKASPERWEGEPLLPRSGRHPDQPVRKSS